MPAIRQISKSIGVTGWLRRLRPLIYLACGLAFLEDVTQSVNDTIAFGVFYIPLISTALLSRDRRTVWVLSGIAVFMVGLGAMLPAVNPYRYDLILNRSLSIIAIIATALFVAQAQQVQQRLAEQTRRAEEAERLKTAFFTNLSQDMRVPLHAIIGLSQLMKMDCPPGRRESLTHVQSATRRLLATIDNLIDLAHFGTRPLRRERLKLAEELRRSVKEQHDHAAEHGINLRLHIAEMTPPVTGDGWAARRIVQNVVGNAVRFTQPGGTVTVSMTPRNGGVAVVVSDTGDGMPDPVIRQLDQNAGGQDEGGEPANMGSGLALTRQLADAIGAELHFESLDGVGTTVTILFPAAGRVEQTGTGNAVSGVG